MLRAQLDDHEIREYLDHFTPQSVNRVLRKASQEAAKAMKPIIRAEVPVGPTGNLRAAVRNRRIRRNPAIGQVVGPMGKKASHRHLVEGGTRAHVITPRGRHPLFLGSEDRFAMSAHHPGARANSFAERAAGPAFQAGFSAAERVIDDAIAGSTMGVGGDD